VLLASLPLLHLTTPLLWGDRGPALWYPPAGIGLALIAWFGPRAALWLAMDGLLVVLQMMLWRLVRAEHGQGVELGLAGVDALLGAALLQVSWWVHHDRRYGARGLGEPRSAMRFLFLVPGFGIGLWAVLHTALSCLLTEGSVEAWPMNLAAFWLSRSLGVMILTPWLLVVLTPWLARHGFVRTDPIDGGSREPLAVGGEGERLTWGDGVEMFGLAAGAGTLSWLLVQNGQTRPVSWQLWGAPLLLIVWASLRQGLRGSTLVAAVSAGLPLMLMEGESFTALFALLVRGNLLGQCVVALLVAAAVNWVRGSEDRYRQVMAHVPVVIYSARFRRPGRPRPVGDLAAEVTLVSAASEPLLGWSPCQLLGDHERWLEHVHPDDREVVRAALVQIGRQERPVICEYRVTHGSWISDGEATSQEPRPTCWVRDTLAPRLDADGQLVGWEGVLTDITEQRALADDLRRTTNMLHALVGNLPAGVFFVQGSRGHPILVNARARQLLGQREEMAAGLEHLAEVYRLHRPDGTLYPVEELPVYMALRKGLTTMRDDIVVHRPDGRRTPLVTWAAPVTLTRGDPLSSVEGQGRNGGGAFLPEAAVWVLEDLTAMHQAEAARRDTEGRLRAILETMAEGLLVQDNEGRIIDCNSAACGILGHPPERLRGMTLGERDWSLLREDGTPLPTEEYPAATVLHMGRPVRNLVLGIRHHYPPSKDIRWVLVNAMPLGGGGSGENHGTVGVVATCIDISTSIRAQKMMRESEEKYRELVESLPLMVIQADDEMRVTYANPATHRITGYDLGEFADPQLWCTLLHPDDRPILVTLARDALEGRGGRVEFRYRAKDGGDKVGLAFTEPRRRADGVIAGTTTLIVDVTRERQLEQNLLRAQRLELVGRLSSGIAHDFNNLLSVVLSMTELVSSALPVEDPVQADLQRITEATEQAASLANQLLTFSKQHRVASRRIEINRVASRTLELLRASLPARIELKAELAEQDLFILADETQIQQVLMNLCLNARDAMPEGGLLHVQTSLVPGESDGVRLSVRDRGTGLSEHVKAHLFDPFFSTKEHGTGLGLAVVHQIVESQGGRIEVSSELGCGACFEVYWPVANDPASE